VFPLPPLALEVAMLMSALPVAVNVFVLAVRYEAYVEQASRAMLFSTMLSLVVISGLLVAMGH
jgi:malonate transporter and related proteins